MKYIHTYFWLKRSISNVILLLYKRINFFRTGKISKNHQAILDDASIFQKRERFELKKDDLQSIVKDIHIFLENELRVNSNSKVHSILDNFFRYYVQYIGYKQSDNYHYVHCNFMLNKNENWKTIYPRILDGGSSYWKIEYCIEKRSSFDLKINNRR